jgi:hypothetical protein
MLESILELPFDLFLSALTLVIWFLHRRLNCCGPASAKDHDQHTPVQERTLSGEIHYG